MLEPFPAPVIGRRLLPGAMSAQQFWPAFRQGKASLWCSWNGPGGIDWRNVYRGGAGGVDSMLTSSQSPNIQEPSSGFPSSPSLFTLSSPATPVALESLASTRHEKIRQASVQCRIYCVQWVTNTVQGKDSLKTKTYSPLFSYSVPL